MLTSQFSRAKFPKPSCRSGGQCHQPSPKSSPLGLERPSPTMVVVYGGFPHPFVAGETWEHPRGTGLNKHLNHRLAGMLIQLRFWKRRPWGQQEPIWAQLGRNLRRTQASWLQLGPSLSPTGVQHGIQHGTTWARFGRKLGLTCATWSCVGASGAEAGCKTDVGNMAQHEPAPKPKNVGNSGKNASFQRAAVSLQNWPGWAQLGHGLPLKRPNLGPKLRYLGPDWSPSWSGWASNWSNVMRMEVQHATVWNTLATASHQVGPTGDTTLGTLLNTSIIEGKKHGTYQWIPVF